MSKIVKTKPSKTTALRDHNTYLWLVTEMNTLIDNALAVSTQYDWINIDADKQFVMQLMERDIKRIANHVATNPNSEKEEK